MSARGLVAASVVAVLTSACTAADEPGSHAPSTEQRSQSAPPADPDTGDGADPNRTERRTEPLVIATSVLRGPLHLTTRQARGLLNGRIDTWGDVGQPGGRIDRVRHLQRPLQVPPTGITTAQLVVMPASAATPLVSVATVAGIDPVREPSRYPLRVRTDQPQPVVTRLTFVGDIMLGRGVAAANPGRPGRPLQPLAPRLAAADITVGNLESTLSDEGLPQQGDDSFAADPIVIPALHRAGFDVLSLANNHTGDFGDLALRQTVRRLDNSGMARVGAGLDARDAWRAAVVRRHGISFGFLAFNAIGETPRATAEGAGAAEVRMQPRTGPLDAGDLRSATTAVRTLARRVDVVVVLPHWGEQYTNRPVRDQRTVGAALLDAGADMVVGGHPHWVQGIDVHDGKLIVNSLGNFVFDMDFSSQTRQGVLLDVVCWNDKPVSATVTPFLIGADFAPRVVHGPVAATILDRMWATSDPPFRGNRVGETNGTEVDR